MKEIKVALVHDYLKEFGGAERVLEALHEIYPKAEVFTSVFLPSYLGPHKSRFSSWNIHTSWLQFIPFKAKLISVFRLISPFIFTSFDFSGFDVIIVSSTGAYFPNRLNKGHAIQFCYCHTPPRYLYGYSTARNWKKHKLFAVLAAIANHFLRIVDFYSSERPDYYIANSKEVKSRIEKFYRRDAVVIYPPVTIMPYQTKVPGEYFLTGGRLARAKHVDLIIKACQELGVPLKVFGKSFAGYEDELKSQISDQRNIEFLGEITDERKYTIMQRAKAFLFASEDEDFGIVPVEAMAQGCPVIAYRSGGVMETVIDGKTGIFYDKLTVEDLKQAIKKFEKSRIDPKVCRKRAETFSKERFKKELSSFVNKKIVV